MLKIIKLLFLFLFLVIISLGSLLYSGIKIDSFSFGNFSVSQFYIKLNKKLIVDVEKIVFKSKKSKVKSSLEDLKKDIELLPKTLKFFEKIDIERLVIDGNAFTIKLNKDHLYLDNKFINLSSKFNFLLNKVVFNLYSLHLKDFNVLFQGKVEINYLKEILKYKGNYFFEKIEGDIAINSTKDLLDFELNSNSFKSLKFLKKYLKLSKIAEDWMYTNVKGDIKLQEFHGSIDLNKYKILMNSLKGRAFIDNTKIEFNKKLPQIDAEKISITFKDNTLKFNLNNAKYLNIPLEKSSVEIRNLTSIEKGRVYININAKTKFNKNIKELLEAFKINIPLIQKSGITKAKVRLIIPYKLSKYGMTTKGEFDVTKSTIIINDKFEFYTKKATILLDGRKLDIKNSHFKYKNMLDSVVNLNFDTKTLKINGEANINSFFIGNKNREIVNIKNYVTPISLDLSKNVKIDIKKLKTNVRIDDFIYVNIEDLGTIYPYSKLLKDNSFKNGDVILKVRNDKELSFKANVSGFDLPIEKDNKKIKSLSINGNMKDDILKIASTDNLIKYEQYKTSKPTIKLKNININLSNNDSFSKSFPSLKVDLLNSKLLTKDRTFNLINAKIDMNPKNIYFDAFIKDFNLPILKDGKKLNKLKIKGNHTKDKTEIQTISNDLTITLKKENISIKLNGYDILYNIEDKTNDKIKDFNLNSKNSNIIINDKFKFLADSYEIRIKDNTTFLHLNHKNTDFTFKETKNKTVDIFANNINSEFINTIFDKNIFKNGKFMLLANGTLDNLNGKFIAQNGEIKELGTLNGYKIKNGNIQFNYNKNKELLNIKKLISLGDSVDADGSGVLNLKDMTINSKIKLIFLKDYSGLVASIPILNYLVLGKDRRVETSVDIKGSLKEPKVSTHIAKDTLSIPLNIVKRVLKSPIELLKFMSKSNKEK